MTVRRWPRVAGLPAVAVALIVAIIVIDCGAPPRGSRPPEDSAATVAVVGEVSRARVEEAAAPADPLAGTVGLPRARAQRRLGLDLRRRGELKRAREALEEARDLFSESGRAREQAATSNDLGDVLFQLGDFEGLERVEWQALELAEAAGLSSAAATAWNNLGVGFAARGRPSEALAAHGRCLALRRDLGDASGEAAALHNRGVLLLQLGRLPEGVAELRRAVSLRRGAGATVELGQSLASLAWGLALGGQPDPALATYREALAILAAARADYDLSVALEQRAQLYRRLGRLRAARADLERSRALAEKSGGVPRFHEAYLQLGFGAVLRDQGRSVEALPLLRRSVAAFDLLGGQEGRILARFELARALRAGGSHAEARATLEAALTIVESARADLHLASFRGTYLGGWQDIYRELVDLLAQSALEASAPRDRQLWAARAFAVSERARARALLDVLAAPPAPRSGGAAEPPTLRHQVEQLETAALGRGAGARLAPLGRLRFELERLQESAAQAAGRQSPSAQPAALAAIVGHLDSDTTLLAYSLGAERSWVWQIDSKRVTVRPLAAGPQIEAAARNVQELLPLARQSGFRTAARAACSHLSELVLSPLSGSLAGSRIAVVPDGALHLVPFAALSLPARNEGTLHLLVEDHEVVHLPSAAALVELRRRREARPPALRPLAIVADPVFEAEDPRFGFERRALGGRFRRLLGSADEARRIVAIAGRAQGRPAVPVFSGFAATRELVTGGRLNGYQTLHFASHAVVDADDPALSGFVLSLYRADGRRRDGLLRARDLYGLRLSADLVVLSACQTALGQPIRGEGMVGLADGFFAAGASQLVVSLWEVDDRATAELMSRFYVHLLLHGRSAADALRRAQRELREETEWSSPAYWAAFVALGDWRVGAEARER